MRGSPIFSKKVAKRPPCVTQYCGWTECCSTWQPWETIVCWYLQENHPSRNAPTSLMATRVGQLPLAETKLLYFPLLALKAINFTTGHIWSFVSTWPSPRCRACGKSRFPFRFLLEVASEPAEATTGVTLFVTCQLCVLGGQSCFWIVSPNHPSHTC